MRFLVTAGPTAEDLDDVRFLTNRSTGLMGFAVAAAALQAGHDVVLVTGPVQLEPPEGALCVRVRSAAEMSQACLNAFGECDAVIMTAAVADYTPVVRLRGKMKKHPGGLNLQLTRTPDILGHLAQRRRHQVIIGFALEVEDGREYAQSKFSQKNLDAVVLNDPSAFGAPEARFALYREKTGWQDLGVVTKEFLAARLIELAAELHAEAKASGRPAGGTRR